MSRPVVRFIRPGRSALCSMILAALGLSAQACGDDSKEVLAEPDQVEVPDAYEFKSRFDASQSSVSYSGQTFRLVLIENLDAFIGGLTEDIDSDDFKPASGDVRKVLDSYYAFDSEVSGEDAVAIKTSLPLVQKQMNDLSTGKDLKGKFAGNGGAADHKNWKTDFRGFEGVKGAEELLVKLFDQLDELAVARANGEYAVNAETPVYISAEGINLKEMIEKFLIVGVAYSQATDKYLDDALEEADNAQVEEDGKKKPFSGLEHAWDEGFGYLGAPRNYGERSDEQLAGEGGAYSDANDDGKIDLLSEAAFAPALYAAKRDLGSQDKTDFTADLWTAFRTGRAILSSASDTLTAAEEQALFEQRDAAVTAFENVLAANVVHYLNETLVDLSGAETGDYELSSLAAHFSELKAFALGLQLNPRSRLAGKDFDLFHDKVGSAPVLPDEGAEQVKAYQKSLLEARDLLQKAYGFSDANVGAADGTGGW